MTERVTLACKNTGPSEGSERAKGALLGERVGGIYSYKDTRPMLLRYDRAIKNRTAFDSCQDRHDPTVP
jgi:hypothetical protein